MDHIKADYHVHSSISPDGNVPMDEMCKAAWEKGIKEVVFTDHYEFYLPGMKSEYFHEEYIKSYFKELEKCRHLYDGKLLLKGGMEFGQSYLERDTVKRFIKNYPFDYIIGSVHKLNNVDLEKMEYREDNIHDIADRYYEELLKLARWGEFDCMGHLDLFKRHARRHGFSDEYERHEETIREILKYIIERGKGIELNTSGIRQEAREAMPSSAILKMYGELGGEIITVGSDAHKAQDVGADFETAYEMLNQAGFNRIACYERHKVVRQ